MLTCGVIRDPVGLVSAKNYGSPDEQCQLNNAKQDGSNDSAKLVRGAPKIPCSKSDDDDVNQPEGTDEASVGTTNHKEHRNLEILVWLKFN